MHNLYPHQIEALEIMKTEDVFALLCDMGTGKTRIIIEDWMRRPDLNLFVIAPNSVYRNWVGEIEKTTPKGFANVAYWSSGRKLPPQRRALKDIVYPRYKSNARRVLLMNVEALSNVKDAKRIASEFITSGECMLVIDESTRIKNPTSARTREVLSLGRRCKIKRIMSGLVAPRSPLDVFSQFEFLDWRILGCRNFYSFRAKYAVLRKMSFGGKSIVTVVGYRNIEDLQERISSKSYRVLKEDCLNLPPKIYSERTVELSREQDYAYAELKRQTTTQLSSGEFVSTNSAIGLLQRLHQLTYGHVRDDQGVVRRISAQPREKVLMQTLDECEGKAIIWACFRPTIVRLCELIKSEYGPESVVEFWGDTSPDERELSKQRFQEDPYCRFLVGNPASGGIGITLTAAKSVIYYANSFDLEQRLQSEDRAHRIGQTDSVNYIDLVAKGTIDEKILNALKDKINLAATLTGEQVRQWVR